MLTEKIGETYSELPEAVKSALLALSVLIDRIGSLPKADRDDLFELLQEWRKAETPEDQRSVQRAMEEILAQVPITTRPLPLNDSVAMSPSSKTWAEHVGKAIRKLRCDLGWTQKQLAEKAGLPQSHVSRLENAEYTATNLTLTKIATALGVEVRAMDPCAD